MSWLVVLGVALGGAAGAVLRMIATQQLLRASLGFPFGTLAVNVMGSLLIGFFARMFSSPDMTPALRATLTVGFCGGFTTFSTYSAELIMLMEQGRAGRALLYIVLSTTLAVSATLLGLALGSRVFAIR